MLRTFATDAQAPPSPDFCHTMSCGEQLELRIHRALNATGCVPLREVMVLVENGGVTLSGRVPTYYLKQLAQTVALNVEGVESLENSLTVC